VSGPVLVVDNDPTRYHLLEPALHGASLTSVVVRSASEAIEWVSARVPSLMLVSWRLSPAGGLIETLKACPAVREVPVVALVSADEAGEIERALAAGASDFLCLPCPEAEIRARIGQQLRPRPAGSFSLSSHAAAFFEQAADGIAIFDQGGRLLFANARARALAGVGARSIEGLALEEFIADTDWPLVAALRAGFDRGVLPPSVDLKLRHTDGSSPTVAVTLSVPPEGRAILASLRDVTEERATEAKLRKTTSFLESVIESSADAIISADRKGRILLFNRAAERCFGYAAGEVVGLLNVEGLYPPGVAREVMRRVRAGRGRLEAHRMAVVTRSGEKVPVSLSASLILEEGKEVGTVGVLTDLRERLRMEQRLVTAQEELKIRDRQSIVAELAGAAAHELNQPLTSVMGYAELLKRRLDRDSPAYHGAEIILNEAERMAEIVRKIGTITRYETKSYVGQAKILDLDRASDEADDRATLPPASLPPISRPPSSHPSLHPGPSSSPPREGQP
jgi:PAS domain S-box-containing protein